MILGEFQLYSTNVYLYIPRQTVVVLVGNSVRRYEPVYAKALKLHKGVDNKLQFRFLNQEQKPVDITGKEITCRIINHNGKEILIQKALTHDLPLTGITTLIVTSEELRAIDAQKCSYSIELPDGQYDVPVYVDANGGARGQLDIVDSVLPSFVPSYAVSIPSYAPPTPTVPASFISSVITTKDAAKMTLQINFSEFIGTYVVQGSTSVDTDWYDISSGDHSEPMNDADSRTVTGHHPYIRVKFILASGQVTKILAR